MPSQRAANKKCIATWVEKSVKRRLEQIAKQQGKPLSVLVNELYEHHLNINTPAAKTVTHQHLAHAEKKQQTDQKKQKLHRRLCE